LIINLYEKEIQALKKIDRFRERKLYDEKLYDYASNDYLGLSDNKKLLKKTYKNLKKFKSHSPKSSLLVGGYHPIHKKFEDMLCKSNNFEKAIVVGSGFLANIALIQSLVRKNDLLLLDEKYHASGIMASSLVKNKLTFKHNDPKDLEKKLKENSYNRAIVCIEGVYSMNGDLANKEIFNTTNKPNTILIIDEAHSVGVIGDNLLGILDYHNIKRRENIIKMGTLGKAISSYGAYILASNHIISYLENRAKSIIYTTAPSLFDIELARLSLKHINKNKAKIKQKINKIQILIKNKLNISKKALIFPISTLGNNHAIQIQNTLLKNSFLVGAIRTPTVKKANYKINRQSYNQKAK
jgi:8-amino-7-oxononanoate synthase